MRPGQVHETGHFFVGHYDDQSERVDVQQPESADKNKTRRVSILQPKGIEMSQATP